MPENKSSGRETYQHVAETVGMLPSLNAKDNLYQGIFVLVISLAAFGVGRTQKDTELGLIYLFFGLLSSGLISGFFLLVLGFVRLARRKKSP